MDELWSRLRALYDPDLRMVGVSLGVAAFLLLLLLDDPAPANPSYQFALAATAFSVVAAAAILVYERGIR